jgi:hypothetical protein
MGDVMYKLLLITTCLAAVVVVPLITQYSPDGDVSFAEELLPYRMNSMNIPFIANQGQYDNRVLYYARTFSGMVFVSNKGEIVYSLTNHTADHENNGVALKEECVDRTFHEILGEGRAVTKINYFKGSDATRWRSDIPTYDIVNLGEVYDGIG